MMKHKYYVFVFSVVFGIAALTGCSNSSTTETSATKEMVGEAFPLDEDAILGQVSKIDGDTICIEVGTRKEFNKEDQNGDRDPGQQQDREKDQNGEPPSMLDLTGEEQEIKVTDSTTITRQSMGMRGGRGENAGQSKDTDQKNANQENTDQENIDSSQQKDMPEGQPPESENISLDDISVGDTISVVLGEDNNAESIVVISGGRGMNKEGDSTEGEEATSNTTL